jgi:hypothetical protein
MRDFDLVKQPGTRYVWAAHYEVEHTTPLPTGAAGPRKMPNQSERGFAADSLQLQL